MKKITSEKKNLMLRRQTAMKIALLRAAGLKRYRKCKNRQTAAAKRLRATLVAPKEFRLTVGTTRDALVTYIEAISSHLHDGYTVVLDFRNTTQLHPCGTLYFVANLEALLEAYPTKISGKRPKDDVVEQLFQHIGLLQRLGQVARLEITAANVVNWHYAAGIDASTNAFKSLLETHEVAMGGLVKRSELYDCMSEAVTNTRKHAYPKKGEENRWWMFSQADGDTLSVAICDLGIGIPQSLISKPELRDYLRKLLMIGNPIKRDKTLIKLAASTSRTSTGLAYRGKGLPQMLDFIKNGTVGGFRVLSGHGCYNYDAAECREKSFAYKLPTRGTLVQWTLPLNT